MIKKAKRRIEKNNKSYFLNDCALYKLHSRKKLAYLLGCDLSELQSLIKNTNNYNIYSILQKGKERGIEAPKNFLDKIHTRIATLLSRVRQPDYIHSGLTSRSYVTNAESHIGFHPVLTTDIKSFYPTTTKKMVFNFFFKQLHCSPDVAELLSLLCTVNGHIPTGSRISMLLAYWANNKMFDELYKLSKSQNIEMTVYVDDVTFSGNNVNGKFQSICKNIIEKYNHIMHPKKTILYKAAQNKLITGVIVTCDNIKIRNMQHEKLFYDFQNLKKLSPNEKLDFENKILGRLHSLSSIDKKYLDKARTFKSSRE